MLAFIVNQMLGKVAVAKAYFAEFYFELVDYLGNVKKRYVKMNGEYK
jgi:hypothetical protein